MPLVRYEIRCEHSLANPELYRSAARDDPEGLLEGVAMAGLVGIVRQLGDLAEFASEIFRDIHEELITLGGRGHDLTVRVRQLEAELPTVEKALLSEPNQLRFAYTNGADWHASIRSDQNHCTSGDLPRFVRNFYEACRGPPRLFLLDKFDVAGAGACLKRYTDPSFFKVEWASSELMKAQRAQRDKKARREKKKNRRRKTGQTIAAINQIPARVRYGSASLEDLDGLPQLVASTLKDEVSSLSKMGANQGAGTQVHISSALGRKVNGAEDPSIPSLKTTRRAALQNEGLSQAPSPLKLSAKEIESANMTGKFYRHKESDGMAGRISKIIDMEDHNAVPSTSPNPRSMDKGSIAANGSKPPAPSNVDIPVKPKIIHRVSREDLEAAAMARTGRTSRGTSRGNSSMDLRDGVNQSAGIPRGSMSAFTEPKIMPVKASRKSMEVIGTVQPSGKVPRRTSLDMKEALSRGVKYSDQNSMGRIDVDVADELVHPHSVMSSGVNLNSEVQVSQVVPGARLTNVDTEVNMSLIEHAEAKSHSSPSQSLEQSYSQHGSGNPSKIAQSVRNRANEHQMSEELREAHSLERTVPAVALAGEGHTSPSSDRHNSHDTRRHVFVQVSEAQIVEEPEVDSSGGISDSPTCSSPHLPPVQIVEVFEDGEELPMRSSGGFSPIASSPGRSSNASSPAIEQESVQPSMSILSRRPGEMMSSSSDSAPDSPNVANSHTFDPLYSPPGPRDMIDSPPGNYMGSYSPSAILYSTPFVDYGEPGLSNSSSSVDLGAPSSAVNPHPEVATHPVGLSEVGLSLSSLWSTTPAPAFVEKLRSVEPGGELVEPIEPGGEPVAPGGELVEPIEPGGEPVAPGGEPVEPGGEPVEPVEPDGKPGLSNSSSSVDLQAPSSAVNSHPEVAMHPVGQSEVEHSSSPLCSTTPAPAFTEKLRSSLPLPPRPADSPGSSAPSSPMGSSRQSFQRICVSNPSVQLAPSPLGHSMEDTSVSTFSRDEDSAPSSPSGSVIIKDTPSPPGSPTSNYSESESEGLDYCVSSVHPENLGSLGLVMLTVEDEGFPEQEFSEVAVSENKTANSTHLATTVSERIKQNVILHPVPYTRSGQSEMFIESLPASASETPMSNAVSDHEVIEEDPLLLQGSSRNLQVKYDSASPSQIADMTILKPILTGRRKSRSQNSLASNSPPDSPPREEVSAREEEKSNGLWQGRTSARSPPKPQSRHPQLTTPPVRSSSNSPPYSPTKSVWSEEASSLRWLGRSNHVSPPKPDFSLPPNLVCRSVSNSPPCSPPPPSDSESPQKWMVRLGSSDDTDGSSASSDSPPTSPQKDAPDAGVGVYQLPDSPLPLDSPTMSMEEGDFSPGEPSRSNYEDEYGNVAEHHVPELEPVAKATAGQQLPQGGSDEEVLDEPSRSHPNKFIPIVVTHSDIGHLPSKKSVTESQLYTSEVIDSPPVEEGQQSLSMSEANMSTTTEQANKLPAAGFDIRKTLSTHDALAAAIAQHDRNMLNVLTRGSQESVHRTLPASLDRRVLLEQIRTKSFNLRRTESMEKNEPALRPSANINVAAILEKANAIRQAFVGSDDEDDAEDDWSDS